MNFQILKNKKGDIPITILVIGILAICVLAIFSFYSSNRIFKKSLDSIDIVERILIKKEKISLYEEIGFTQEEIKKIFDIKEDKNIQRKYIIEKEDALSVRYNLPK